MLIGGGGEGGVKGGVTSKDIPDGDVLPLIKYLAYQWVLICFARVAKRSFTTCAKQTKAPAHRLQYAFLIFSITNKIVLSFHL